MSGDARNQPAFIEACVAASFPDGRARLIEADPIPLGLNDLWQLRVDVDDAPLNLVLRRYRHTITWHTDDDRQKAEREVRAIQHARNHGVPAPSLYGYGADWTLVQAVHGHRLLDGDWSAAERARAVRSLAGVLATLHAAPLPEGPFPRATTAAAIAVARDRASASGNARLIAATARLRPLDDGRPVFVHGDANLSNVLFDDAMRVAGLIDWEDAAIADRRLDIATACWFLLARAPELADAFLAAYQAASGQPLVDMARWIALATVRAWAVAEALRASGRALKMFTSHADQRDAERRLDQAGY
jgi:aminoglycoside phosphotransferase (APT) family kinase protein